MEGEVEVGRKEEEVLVPVKVKVKVKMSMQRVGGDGGEGGDVDERGGIGDR